MNDKEKKLAELDDAARRQDEDTRKRDTEHAARTQLLLLRARLLRLGVGGAPDEFATAAQGNSHIEEQSGELRVWFVIDDVAYSVIGGSDGPIYCEHKAQPGDVYEWTVLDEDGQPTEWRREPPAWTTLN